MTEQYATPKASPLACLVCILSRGGSRHHQPDYQHGPCPVCGAKGLLADPTEYGVTFPPVP